MYNWIRQSWTYKSHVSHEKRTQQLLFTNFVIAIFYFVKIGNSAANVETTSNADGAERSRIFGALDDQFVQYILSHIQDTFYPGVELYTSYKIAQMGLKALVDVKPLQPEFGHVINDVSSWRYIIEPGKCEQHFDAVGKRNVFIGIVSSPSNFERRSAIRQTWLRHLKDAHYHRGLMDVIGYAFYTGTPTDNVTQPQIEEEAKIHNDILQIDMVDNYYDLAKKATAFFNWLVNSCSGAKIDFVHKIDDDVYINIRLLASTVAQLSPDEQFFMGNVVDGFYGPPRSTFHRVIDFRFYFFNVLYHR